MAFERYFMGDTHILAQSWEHPELPQAVRRSEIDGVSFAVSSHDAQLIRVCCQWPNAPTENHGTSTHSNVHSPRLDCVENGLAIWIVHLRISSVMEKMWLPTQHRNNRNPSNAMNHLHRI